MRGSGGETELADLSLSCILMQTLQGPGFGIRGILVV